jgi:hypothetical protein
VVILRDVTGGIFSDTINGVGRVPRKIVVVDFFAQHQHCNTVRYIDVFNFALTFELMKTEKCREYIRFYAARSFRRRNRFASRALFQKRSRQSPVHEKANVQYYLRR